MASTITIIGRECGGEWRYTALPLPPAEIPWQMIEALPRQWARWCERRGAGHGVTPDEAMEALRRNREASAAV